MAHYFFHFRMRVLGYPPGWLEEARVQHSGLSLIGQNGVADGGSDEEGEIVQPGDKDQYDIKKIVEYPGFNVMTMDGTFDVRNVTELIDMIH